MFAGAGRSWSAAPWCRFLRASLLACALNDAGSKLSESGSKFPHRKSGGLQNDNLLSMCTLKVVYLLAIQ